MFSDNLYILSPNLTDFYTSYNWLINTFKSVLNSLGNNLFFWLAVIVPIVVILTGIILDWLIDLDFSDANSKYLRFANNNRINKAANYSKPVKFFTRHKPFTNEKIHAISYTAQAIKSHKRHSMSNELYADRTSAMHERNEVNKQNADKRLETSKNYKEAAYNRWESDRIRSDPQYMSHVEKVSEDYKTASKNYRKTAKLKKETEELKKSNNDS